MKTKTSPLLNSQRFFKNPDSDGINSWGIDVNFLDLQLPTQMSFSSTASATNDPFHDLQLHKEALSKDTDQRDINLPEAYYLWLEQHPNWLEDNGFGGIQPQVMSASQIFSSLEFPNPGQARGFDYWYENIFPASNLDPDEATDVVAMKYDSHMNMMGSDFFDALGFSNFISYETLTHIDADGRITGYTQMMNSINASGESYSSTYYYDADWNITEQAHDDHSGIVSYKQYQHTMTLTDADGNITGYTQMIYSSDANGNHDDVYMNHYDANWDITESTYANSSGFSSSTQYQTITHTDAEGNIEGFTYISNTSESSGYSYSYTHNYDANWNIKDSTYADDSGYISHTQYQVMTDMDGNITGYTHITDVTDANGTSYHYTNHYDADWNIIGPIYPEDSRDGFNQEQDDMPCIIICPVYDEIHFPWDTEISSNNIILDDYDRVEENTYQEELYSSSPLAEVCELAEVQLLGVDEYLFTMHEL